MQDEMRNFRESEARSKTDRLARLMEIERWHFWFVGRRMFLESLIRRYQLNIRRSILDLGCGSGSLVETLTRRGHWVVGVDVRSEGLSATRRSSAEALLVQADATHLPFRSDAFDMVILLDVLEHVDEERVLLQLHSVLKLAGLVVISVPAFPWLWGYRDEGAGHLRRYRRRHLVRVLSNAGFEVIELRYYQFFLLPILFLTRFLGRRRPIFRDLEDRPLRLVNALFGLITRVEVKLGQFFSWPAGSSMVAVCRKKRQ